jgi:hypothetical protein
MAFSASARHASAIIPTVRPVAMPSEALDAFLGHALPVAFIGRSSANCSCALLGSLCARTSAMGQSRLSGPMPSMSVISFHEAAVADHIGGKNGSEPALRAFLGHMSAHRKCTE